MLGMDMFFQELSKAAHRIGSIVTDPQSRTYWAYLLVTLVLAICIVSRRHAIESSDRRVNPQAALRTLFARSIWLHPSAIKDYACFVINATFFSSLKVIGVFVVTLTISLSYPLLLKVGGGEKYMVAADIFALSVYTIFVMVWQDLGRYVSHWFLHRVPVLWEFHKVHHSAQVLTPMTLFRIHPCDFIFTALIAGTFAGSAVTLGLFVFANKVEPLGIFGIDFTAFIF
jgi:sterol desaturase/sphingolipid hydroxylase (fatty acid hydroxylase superfamily)